MARDDPVKRYKSAYARLLGFYPESYRARFAEPMQQMFADMCDERRQAGEDMRLFVVRTYAETFFAVAKERADELVTNIKANKARIIPLIGSLGLLAVIPLLSMVDDGPAQSISPLTSFEQTQQLSKGSKDACLGNNPHALDAVTKDDSTIDFDGGKISEFEITASAGIMDVPAGTDYDLTVYSYENGIARGAITYDQHYGAYNYTIKKLAGVGKWEFVSMVACE